jgi:prepilin peptidase CpaA
VTILPAAAVLLSGVAACVTDLRARRIPNWLTFGSTAVALGVHVMLDGWAGAQYAGAGWIVGTLLFLPMFLLGGMGGGDVKLLAAFGAWLGPGDVLWLAAYASIAGGLIGIAVALRHRYFNTMLRNLQTLLRFWWLAGPRPLPSLTLERGSGPRLAYAVPMFVGALVTLWRH